MAPSTRRPLAPVTLGRLAGMPSRQQCASQAKAMASTQSAGTPWLCVLLTAQPGSSAARRIISVRLCAPPPQTRSSSVSLWALRKALAMLIAVSSSNVACTSASA
ncbi:hypothetical protein D3C72_2105470 [compost metagenome]